MKKEEIKRPSLEEQISNKKKLFESFKLDMVYGQEALCLLANRKKIEVDNYIQGVVGPEQYREGVINYLITIKNHLQKKTNSDLHLISVGTEIFVDDNINYVFASKLDSFYDELKPGIYDPFFVIHLDLLVFIDLFFFIFKCRFLYIKYFHQKSVYFPYN